MIPRHTRAQNVEGGNYIYFGLEESLQRVLENHPDLEDDAVDGLSVIRPISCVRYWDAS